MVTYMLLHSRSSVWLDSGTCPTSWIQCREHLFKDFAVIVYYCGQTPLAGSRQPCLPLTQRDRPELTFPSMPLELCLSTP